MNFVKNKPYTFISYSHRDKNLVLPLIEKLRQNGVNLWYDNGIEAGSEWPEYIAEKIINCENMICFISSNYDESQNCKRELNFAIEEKKSVLSVFLQDDVKLSGGLRMQLGSYQALYYGRYNGAAEFAKMLSEEGFVEKCILKQRNENDVNNIDNVNKYTPPAKTTDINVNPIKPTPSTENAPAPAVAKKEMSFFGKLFWMVFFLGSVMGAYRHIKLIVSNISYYKSEGMYDLASKYTVAYVTGIVFCIICALFSLMVLFWGEMNLRLGKTGNIVSTIVTSCIALIVNYWCCQFIAGIPFMNTFLTILALFVINAVLEFVQLVAVAMIFE